MPIYEYECQDCGHRDDEFQHMADAPLDRCPACGGRYARQVSRPSGAMTREYRTPIEMHSIAVTGDDEIRAFRRRNPGAEITHDGVPIARTRQEKLRILKNEGFQERN